MQCFTKEQTLDAAQWNATITGRTIYIWAIHDATHRLICFEWWPQNSAEARCFSRAPDYTVTQEPQP